ncbi:MAG: TAXI family TRAP transporter solute-binding subunit [Clostridia bacterium]|nr:TAXI family TRAP transporter solute-binding subunit [Clostridia bacterium]
MHSKAVKKILVLVLTLGLLSAFVVGCGGGSAGPDAGGGSSQEGQTAPSQRPERISIATGGTGGTYYPYGGAMADIINKYVDGLEAAAEVTGASVENARLLDSGDSAIGLLMNDVVYMAVNGEGAFDKAIDLRTLFVMYPNIMHVVSVDAGKVNSISDLKGKKVSVGAPGSGTETMSSEVLGALDITYDDFSVFRLSFAENTQALRDNVIDVGIWSVGAPTSSIMDLVTTHQPNIISFTEDEISKVTAAKPYYNRTVIPAGTYDKQPEDVATLAVWNSVIVHSRMSEDMAYTIVKAIFDNIQDIINVYPGAKDTTPENLISAAEAPLHPGAIKYLEEIGIDVPERLIPPEMK